METALKIALNILGPLWGCKIDLKDAYFHVPVSWLFQMFLAFELGGQLVEFQFLQFGSGSCSLGLGETPEVLDRVAALGVSAFQGAEFHNKREVVYNSCAENRIPRGSVVLRL